MTDRLECPDCGGTGEARIGALVMQCEFCCGAGYVGDDNEPAEEHPPGPPSPVWGQVGADALPGCPFCLGRGVVISLGSERPAKVMVEVPCAACSGKGRDTS
ncbi:hypothetical protein GCM10022214_17250 [Actinomadura miaoliensis]|uniref:Transcription factor zinc-finger domain-containing protein n=1 Tax=Actinomadura miaoliensis TaxID=430685 RepID=A0ABP7VCP8_9ACTN